MKDPRYLVFSVKGRGFIWSVLGLLLNQTGHGFVRTVKKKKRRVELKIGNRIFIVV